MDELWLIGIGMGSPNHLTREGEAAIRAADTILVPHKGSDKADLAELRYTLCADVLDGDTSKLTTFQMPKRDETGDYREGVDAWHDVIALAWQAAAYKPGKTVLLVWGDPSLYDSTLRIASRLTPQPPTKVIPGITALQALTAAHAIPLNTVGGPVTITTGRNLRDHGWPDGVETLAIMLDGDCAFQHLDPTGITIWWGGFLGLPNQVLRHGPLAEVSEDIIQTRAAARAKQGWIMDTYLLRRS